MTRRTRRSNPPKQNEIRSIIVDCAVALHRETGPGLLETVYEAVLARDLEAQSLLRHSTPELTMNVYARARSERLGELADRVGTRLGYAAECEIYVKRPKPGSGGKSLTPPESMSYMQGKMVEAAGIEPASEGASTCASTCVACPLRIRRPGTPQAGFSGSLDGIVTRRPNVPPASGDEARCRRLSHLAGGQW